MTDQDLKALQSLLKGPWSEQLPISYGNSVFAGDIAEVIRLWVEARLSEGFNRSQLSILLAEVLEDRATRESPFEWVVTGHSSKYLPVRDTAVIFRSVVQQAENDILLVSYAVYNGRSLFQEIHRKMVANPTLRVRFIVNVDRTKGDTSLSSEILKRFVRDFRKGQWPAEPWPELYYDPRSLIGDPKEKAVIHAKCILADRRLCFVSSANFTEAAQEKNVEVGTLIRDRDKTENLQDYFDDLIAQGLLVRMD